MKKFLSLVLALVMTMSLVTVSAGAKDFTDNSKINYKEAVDVMSAAKVIDGYAEGDFRPSNTLTRGAAAKIICNLILGPTTAEALVADAAPYKDVPTTNNFAGYIAYCAKARIISGYADGTFRPAATLSGYAFMKMLLGALGYDATAEGYTGNNWSIQVAKRALSANVDLADGLNGDFNGIKAVTREEACLYAFNTLKATMVEYENSNSVTVNGITFTNKSTAKEMTCVEGSGNDGNIKKDGKVQFAEKYFSDLKGTPATDDLGHPSTKWMWKKDKIGTYANEADETYTLTGTYEIGTGKDYASLLAVLKDEDFTDNKDLKLAKDVDVYVNGAAVKTTEAEAVVKALMNDAKGGTTVELYYNDDDKDVVDCVTILNYSIGQIKDVSTKLTKDQKDDGATSKIKVEGKWYLDNDVVGFDSKTYVEDAYVLYILKSTTEMSASQIAEEITGKVTAIKGSDKATVGGTQYKYVKNAVTIDVDDEGSFYLNVAGQIAAVDTNSKSDNYAYIYNLKKDTNKVNSDGVLADTITAYYVTTDGTKASAVVDADVETTSGEKTFYYADTKTEVESGVVIAFSINSDGELVLETEKDTIKNNVTKTIDKTHAAGTDSDTQFIFAYADGSKFKTSTAAGYKNVSVKGQQVCTVTNKDGDYLYVFVGVKNGTLSSDVQYAVVTDGKASKTKDGKDTFYSYDAIINGEESTLTFKTSTDPKLTKGAAYAFELDGKNVKDNKVTSLNFAQVTAGTKNYVEVGGTQYNLDDDVKAIYTVTLEYKTEDAYKEATKGTTLTFADLDSVTVSEGADIDNKSWVAYNVDGSDLDVLFVVDFVY